MRFRLLLLLTLVAFASSNIAGRQSTTSNDWPQWRGPDRTGLSKETGLLKQWPAGGPSRVWLNSGLGAGYGAVSVKGGKVFVQSLIGNQSTVAALNQADGKIVWSRSMGQGSDNDMGPGPRGTPTVDGDLVYVLSESGELACLKALDGSVVWQKNILREFRGYNIRWLISESPLVDGNNLIVTPGGSGSGVVALDKMTGKTVWTSRDLSDEAGYSSVIAADVQGVRTLMTITSEAAVGLRASDGRLMWRYPKVANNTANIATPVYSDNKVFYSTGYDTGGALLRLTAQGGMVSAQEVYFTREMQNHHGGVILVNGYLYGFNNSILACLEFATGKLMWRNRSVGKGSLTYADGNLYIMSEGNVVGLVEANPTAYVEKGRFEIADSGLPSWAHPVVSGGRLYIRNQSTLTSYDIRAR